MVYGHLTNQEGDTPPMNNWHSLIPRITYLRVLLFRQAYLNLTSKSVDPNWRSLRRTSNALICEIKKLAEKFHSHLSFLWNMTKKWLRENGCSWKFFSFIVYTLNFLRQ